MKFIAFDLETMKLAPENWNDERLGIACACVTDGSMVQETYMTSGPVDERGAKLIVTDMMRAVSMGHQIVTWNGLWFDFRVLAAESGMVRECAEIALRHIDLMFVVVTHQGHYLGQDKACLGAGVQGKVKRVRLKNGTALEGIDGSMVPALWAAGEQHAVLEYLRGDVQALHRLMEATWNTKRIRWTTPKQHKKSFLVQTWTVENCLSLPLPKTPWMDKPVRREDFFNWMGEYSPYSRKMV